ncbi:hypothetical protein K469DRAFT_690372 [Zopfia rhizophila CBS 207.26]|uniref:GPI anchored serine-threonine rich protein n=1 Tax=Zopfia rhizophila CBS 207.26 TaxID=1314779 RepID=A0A6A6DXK0_9PEZI|nr:hypothetical protein K469DRAFT_690372 [Zopfia rhizophila CBS 207.26]
MIKILAFTLLASFVLASDFTLNSPLLARRQERIPCSQQTGVKACETEVDCIPLSYTCCPPGNGPPGGCPPTERCWLGTNGEYGCCPLGETCAGPGGVNQDSSIIVSTITDLSTFPASSEAATITSTYTSSSTLTITEPSSSVTPTFIYSSYGSITPSGNATVTSALPSLSTTSSPSQFTGAAAHYVSPQGLLAAGALAAARLVL